MKIVFTYNYKDGENTVSLNEVLASGLADSPRNENCSAARQAKPERDRSSMKALGVPNSDNPNFSIIGETFGFVIFI